jgi:hypothetical protein
MPETVRLSPQEAKARIDSGALLVCAYEDEDKCRLLRLEGSLTLGELRSRLPELSLDQEIVFYCA